MEICRLIIAHKVVNGFVDHISLKIKTATQFLIWASTLSSRFANNKNADQPEHPRRQVSASAIRFLESIISNLATGEI